MLHSHHNSSALGGNLNGSNNTGSTLNLSTTMDPSNTGAFDVVVLGGRNVTSGGGSSSSAGASHLHNGHTNSIHNSNNGSGSNHNHASNSSTSSNSSLGANTPKTKPLVVTPEQVRKFLTN